MAGNNRNWALRHASVIAASALGADFASGRLLALFYAQLGRAAWVGILVSGLVFGMLTGTLVWLCGRCGAAGIARLLRRIPGVGRGVQALWVLVTAGAAVLLLSRAGEMAALMLPLKHAHAWGWITALLAAGFVALDKSRLCRLSCAYLAWMCMYLIALAVLGRMPEAPRMRYALELRLKNNYAAALLFALPHAALCLCVSAGTAARLVGGCMRPRRLGLWSGVLLALLLGLGNAVLALRSDELLALALPFPALSGGWGTAGFYLSAGLVFLAAVVSLAGMAYGLFPAGKRRNRSENDVKL